MHALQSRDGTTLFRLPADAEMPLLSRIDSSNDTLIAVTGEGSATAFAKLLSALARRQEAETLAAGDRRRQKTPATTNSI